MLQLTIQEALESPEKTSGQCIYQYKDGDTLLYLGRSNQPCERLRQHLGQGTYMPYPDAIGTVILDNVPQSLTWTVEIWTLEELNPQLYQEALMTGSFLRAISQIEEELIYQRAPCLNALGKRRSNPLPARYIKRKIANAGVKLE